MRPVLHWDKGQCAWPDRTANPREVTCALCLSFMRERRPSMPAKGFRRGALLCRIEGLEAPEPPPTDAPENKPMSG